VSRWRSLFERRKRRLSNVSAAMVLPMLAGSGRLGVVGVARIIPYPSGSDIAASRDFYIGVLGLELAMEDPVLCLSSPVNPSAEVILSPPGFEDPQPSFGVDVGDPAAVDAAHAEAVRRGLRVVYPLTNEPWGVRRFFVEDPGGTIVNVLAHAS
jgi:catechol 2,3-dioxygenase-like lactoylglutathione lyase family enzyme